MSRPHPAPAAATSWTPTAQFPIRALPWLVLACGPAATEMSPPADPAATTSTHQDIGADGGDVHLAGVTLEIPRGALPETVRITMALVDAAPDADVWSPVIDFGPDGLAFLLPADVTFPVSRDHADAVVWWSSGTAVEALPSAWLDGAVRAPVSHFSRGHAGAPPSDSDTPPGETDVPIDTDPPGDTDPLIDSVLPDDTGGGADSGLDLDTDGLPDTSADTDLPVHTGAPADSVPDTGGPGRDSVHTGDSGDDSVHTGDSGDDSLHSSDSPPDSDTAADAVYDSGACLYDLDDNPSSGDTFFLADPQAWGSGHCRRTARGLVCDRGVGRCTADDGRTLFVIPTTFGCTFGAHFQYYDAATGDLVAVHGYNDEPSYRCDGRRAPEFWAGETFRECSHAEVCEDSGDPTGGFQDSELHSGHSAESAPHDSAETGDTDLPIVDTSPDGGDSEGESLPP